MVFTTTLMMCYQEPIYMYIMGSCLLHILYTLDVTRHTTCLPKLLDVFTFEFNSCDKHHFGNFLRIQSIWEWSIFGGSCKFLTTDHVPFQHGPLWQSYNILCIFICYFYIFKNFKIIFLVFRVSSGFYIHPSFSGIL